MMKYSEALAQALVDAMKADAKVLCLGVGVSDEKGVFGTTKPAHDIFPDRVLETPLSENMLTGACVGLAIEGYRPVLVHARCDFLMLTMEHIVNSAAKWRSIGHDRPLGMTVRAIVGRGWGQGPNHSQALQAMFAHVPGLRVYLPFRPEDAYYGLRHALKQPDPVIFIEHRRLYNTETPLIRGLGRAEVYWGRGHLAYFNPVRHPLITILAFSAALLDAVEAARVLEEQGVPVEVFDPQMFPLPLEALLSAIGRTGRLIVVDTGHAVCGLSAEIIALAAMEGVLCAPPVRITPRFAPCPTSLPLEEAWYPKVSDIVAATYQLLERPMPRRAVPVTSDSFQGPF